MIRRCFDWLNIEGQLGLLLNTAAEAEAKNQAEDGGEGEED